MTSHALLLRLFLSPTFFSLHVALRYLLIYSDNIGITYYLTRRLKELDVHELYDVWGFVCHLLVTRPTKSRALEVFVVETAQRSTHIAMITLWFLQAAIHDLSTSHRNSQSFTVCQRVLHKCHEIIFDGHPRPVRSPYASLKFSGQSLLTRKKIRHHVEPALAGIGVILASAPGMPALSNFTGQIAIEQGRADEDGHGLRSLDAIETDFIPNSTLESSSPNPIDENELESLSIGSSGEPSPTREAEESLETELSLVRRNTISAAQTMPALPLHLQTIRRSRASEDPLGQLDFETASPAPHQSSPSLTDTRRPSKAAFLTTPDLLLDKYDTLAQTQLLRGHYCHSEIQFILDLESICNKLLIVPKPARVSALRAELTALNHKLPAEVCMPMWCSSSDIPIGSSNIPQPHHRIVRIPPGESVVLNSAERAPYLLLIEILHEDLDFDPSKRTNKDTLRKIVTKEHERRGASKDLVPFGRGKSKKRQMPQPQIVIDDSDLSGPNPNHRNVFEPTLSTTPATAATYGAFPSFKSEEEIDLVEQLYGSDQPLKSANLDITESIMLPPPPKNKDLDRAAWVASVPSTPLISGRAMKLDESTALSAVGRPNGSHVVLSLDEYSERMRTAAIMLAQLNANLVREQVPVPSTSNSLNASQDSISPHAPSSRGTWISGTSWLIRSSSQSSNEPSSLHPDHFPQTPVPQMSSHVRLQPAEAKQIRDRIMKEMISLEEERMERMKENRTTNESGIGISGMGTSNGDVQSAEDEGIIRRELSKADPSAVVFSESWATKKSRIKSSSPYGHLANWDCVSVIVKTGGDLRQEQLAVQLIREFQRVWTEENCPCWVRYFRILITGASSGLVETITDAVSIHSIKKAEYAKRLTRGTLGHVTLMDHFKSTYGDPSSAKFARAQRNFAKSLAGYSIVTFLLQIKDRHNGNILLDRDGHLIHIDFGFMLSNTPGNIGFEAAPFKLPLEYVEVLGGLNSVTFLEFRRLFREGFEAARKHCDRIITLVELMQKDSTLPCFASYGEQTATQLRDRFQPTLTHSLIGEYVDRLIDTSLGSNWTRLYDSYQYYSQSIL